MLTSSAYKQNRKQDASTCTYVRTVLTENCLRWSVVSPNVSRAGGLKDMNSMGTGLERIGDVLADIGHEFRPHDCGHYEVRRTRYDEDRKPIPKRVRYLVYKRDHFRCVWCGTDERLQLDHILPWSAGGSDNIDNLRTLCARCNARRSNQGRSTDLWMVELPCGRKCVDCNHSAVQQRPEDAEPIFCTTCEEFSVGIPYTPGYTAWFRGYGHDEPEAVNG